MNNKPISVNLKLSRKSTQSTLKSVELNQKQPHKKRGNYEYRNLKKKIRNFTIKMETLRREKVITYRHEWILERETEVNFFLFSGKWKERDKFRDRKREFRERFVNSGMEF